MTLDIPLKKDKYRTTSFIEFNEFHGHDLDLASCFG